MLFSNQISKRAACILLVIVHVCFIYFQAAYQLSVLQYNGLLFKQHVVKGAKEKGSLGTVSSRSTDILSKSKLVPCKRFFQNQCILVEAPTEIERVAFFLYQFDQYTDPVIVCTTRSYPERGPPATA